MVQATFISDDGGNTTHAVLPVKDWEQLRTAMVAYNLNPEVPGRPFQIEDAP